MLDERGREIPDPTPVEVPLNFRRPESMSDMIKRLVKNELSVRAAAEGMETFEESDDFDVEEEEEFASPYELKLMTEELYEGARTDAPGVSGAEGGRKDGNGNGEEKSVESADRELAGSAKEGSGNAGGAKPKA